MLVAVGDDDTIQMIDTKTGQIADTLPSGPDPETFVQDAVGRLLYVANENDNTVTVQTPNEVLILPKNEIEERTRSPLSMMPEGQINQLKDSEVRDLVSYLASPKQVALPPK